MVAISSWGRLGSWEHDVHMLFDRHQVPLQLNSSRPGIPHGMGRSYGDVCLNPQGLLWKTTGLDRFIHFDQSTGRLVCETGVLLRDIQRHVIPRGWILPVTPGTQMVTVGGAIANDVHGKNYHVFVSFGDHVRWLKLIRTNTEIIECSPKLKSEMFAATVGGIGLTGVIIEAEIQLHRVVSPWLNTETVPYDNLDEFFQLADSSEADWEHTVSWIDCISASGARALHAW
jgi:FAD/FMN-containing dehydrogenase